MGYRSRNGPPPLKGSRVEDGHGVRGSFVLIERGTVETAQDSAERAEFFALTSDGSRHGRPHRPR